MSPLPGLRTRDARLVAVGMTCLLEAEVVIGPMRRCLRFVLDPGPDLALHLGPSPERSQPMWAIFHVFEGLVEHGLKI
jgi:hypothetical protein